MDNDVDTVKFSVLFYIHSFTLSEESTTTVIDRKNFDLVQLGRYIDYPWGKKALDIGFCICTIRSNTIGSISGCMVACVIL